MPAYVIFEACRVRKKPYVMLHIADYQGNANTESNLKGFIVVKFCEQRLSSVGGIMLFLSSWSG